ncbi:MAG: 4-(cytidine 5'-diphospho)-2-C-methyl-D-erythritol kinase [Candidatus Omnitrophica bacterium]|nr:4-(cytidine 5'-diphospho)-2-C-methyl-D-erythritol kinase [Candidatus Omnitrophota bacterium]MCM8825024.1 4-(cytidine 5'-diphospho)-2-C-methyl-D-erythritol kinase [Candidatus Omnitrophota bacterium]
MEKIKELAPAKINLFLEITGKRPDGYHNICSLVEKVNIFDVIEIFPAPKTSVEFKGPWKIPEVNTVTKTLNELSFLLPDVARKKPFKIVVNKKIPPGSGLGGASSDAAAILKALNKLWDIDLDKKSLVEIAARIGSDVPLFLYEGPCIIEGRGDVVYPVEKLPSLMFELFVPEFQISTKEVYGNVSFENISDLTQAHLRIKILISMWRSLNIEEMEKLLFNRLEEVTLRINKEIAEIIQVLEVSSGRRFMLTGSGGGVYAIEKRDGRTLLMNPPEIIRRCRHYKIESYRKSSQKEEHHGNN